MNKVFFNLSKIYGSVLGLSIGSNFGVDNYYISVCGYDAVHEALHNPDLDGRMDMETSQLSFILSGKKGGFNNYNKSPPFCLIC